MEIIRIMGACGLKGELRSSDRCAVVAELQLAQGRGGLTAIAGPVLGFLAQAGPYKSKVCIPTALTSQPGASPSPPF